MTAQPQLKPIAPDGIPHALEKAERYRLLNDPAQADSIYRDILAVDPDHQGALRGLVLALTDQLGGERGPAADREARELIDKFDDEYDRAYYMGIVLERETRAFLQKRGVVRSGAYHGFREAMMWYERAEALRPKGDVDAVLRWNSCVRAIDRERLEPEPDHPELPLE
jgi:hypothetical protein